MERAFKTATDLDGELVQLSSSIFEEYSS